MTPIDPASVRKLVEQAVDRVLGSAPAATAATAARPEPPRPAARIVDWSHPAPGDVRPVVERAKQPARPGGGKAATADPARTVAIGGDHGGFALKESLRRFLSGELGFAVIDCGSHSTEAVDYPDIARAVGDAVAQGRAFRGIVIDGAGIGSTMAANRIPGVRCALCHDVKTVLNSREHNDANVLALGAGIVNLGLARQMVTTWLKTPFAGGRHTRRVAKIMELEGYRAPLPGRTE